MGIVGGNIGFDEGGVAQGIAAILEALNKEGVTQKTTIVKKMKSGKIKTTETTSHISLLTPGAILLIYLLFQLYEKAGGIATDFAGWLNNRMNIGSQELQRAAQIWQDPDLYKRRMGDISEMQAQSTYTSTPTTTYTDAQGGGGTFTRNIGVPDTTQQHATAVGTRVGTKQWYRNQGLEPPIEAPGI